MKKTIVVLMVFLLTLVSTLSAKPGSASLPESVVPGNAQWVIHMDMDQFRRTRISEFVKGDNINWLTIANQMMKTKYRIDLITGTESITIFGMDGEKRNAVVCLQGNFDKEFILSKLREAAGYKKTSLGSYTVHRWRDTQFCVFVDDQRVVYSLHAMDETALKDVLEAIAGRNRNTGASELMVRMKEMPKNAFLKAAAADISALKHHGDASMILKKTGLALFVALERNENLTLSLKLTTDTPETAKNFEQIVNGFIALARMKHQDDHFRQKILSRVKTTLGGNVLRVELSHPSDDLISLLEKKHNMPFQRNHD